MFRLVLIGGINIKVDNFFEIKKTYLKGPSILSKTVGVDELFQLSHYSDQEYFPLEIDADQKINDKGYFGVEGINNLTTSVYDKETRVLEKICCSPSGLGMNLLNLPNSLKDVRLRQEAIKELINNKKALKILNDVFAGSFYERKIEYIRCSKATPETIDDYLNSILKLEEAGLKTEAFKKTFEWVYNLKQDTLFQELIKKKRKVTDSRIIGIYSERHKGFRVGLLKSGVKPEDFLDLLEQGIAIQLEDHIIMDKRYNVPVNIVAKRKLKEVAKSKTKKDEYMIEKVIFQAKQRMDILNKASRKMFIVPGLLMHLQLEHLYNGAKFYYVLKNKGLPVVFPEIREDKGYLNLKNILPIRIILEKLIHRDYTKRQFKSNLCDNSFNFSPDEKVIQIQGPNNRGKSEAWRTLHLFNLLTNSGYPVPAKYASSSVIANSHFISCKGNMGTGGSELERSVNNIFDSLKNVKKGDQVIFDEFGDSTNAPVAREFAKRLIPELVEKGIRVLLTTHHDAISSYISDELKGVSLMPNPDKKGVYRYELVPSGENIDFEVDKTLKSMNVTPRKIKITLSKSKKPHFEMPKDYFAQNYSEKKHRKQTFDGTDVPF